MPTIEVSFHDLCDLIGRTMSLDELTELIFATKCEIKKYDSEKSVLTIDVETDRVDLLSAEGVARELRGMLEIEMGMPRYETLDSGLQIRVEPIVRDVRPYFFSAVVGDLELTDTRVVQMMQLSEKLDGSLGRGRRKASMGLHDLDKITPPITYTARRPEEISFVPLEGHEEMTGKEILERTKQGRQYGDLVRNYPLYPVIEDATGTVLSLPPIINSEYSRITPDTGAVFVDLSCTDEHVGTATLNVFVTNLAERKARIQSVRVAYPEKQSSLPDLTPKRMTLNLDFANSVLDLSLSPERLVKLLARRRMDAREIDAGKIEVLIPPYRTDFMHEIDLVEDVAIAYGYSNFEPKLPQIMTIGKELDIRRGMGIVREYMVGFGFQELLTYVMTNKDTLFGKMNQQKRAVVEVEHPMSLTYTVLRDQMVPVLLEFLASNTYGSIPQKVFEIGDVVSIDEEMETKTKQSKRLGIVIRDYAVGFDDIQAVVSSLLKCLKITDYGLKAIRNPSYIDGRVAEVNVQGRPIGHLGEISPLVVAKFDLKCPICAAEMDVESLLQEAPA
jgi:phenylalanyl-tRNA synthetase beta chain